MKISIRAIATLAFFLITSFGVQAVSPAIYASHSLFSEASMIRDETQKNKWNQEAREFDAAINELKGILRLDIETDKGIDEATKILERNADKLRLAESKIATGVLRSAAFKKGVEDESKKRGGDKRFAEDFKKDPGMAKNIPGLQEAAREAESAITPARELLTQLGTKFDAAAKKQRSSSLKVKFEGWNETLSADQRLGERACGDGLPSNTLFQNPCQLLGINIIASACKVIYNVILSFVNAGWTIICGDSCIGTYAVYWAACIAKAGLSSSQRSACNSTFMSNTVLCMYYVCSRPLFSLNSTRELAILPRAI